jgi:hypothetical protein
MFEMRNLGLLFFYQGKPAKSTSMWDPISADGCAADTILFVMD